MKATESFGISYTEALEKLKKSGNNHINLSKYGDLWFDIYSPTGKDDQQPHDKDEIYMVISGNGTLNSNGVRTVCKQGDILFVPAGVEHRFEGFTKDFCTWAIFSTPGSRERVTM
jgi:mannose-6-phosphate isomerase-like protein (cupin superfamily)